MYKVVLCAYQIKLDISRRLEVTKIQEEKVSRDYAMQLTLD